MKAMTNVDLLRMFRRLNKEWFDNNVPEPAVIRFKRTEEEDASVEGDTLEVHTDFARHPRCCELLMLHEMGHCMLPECKVHHGMRWCAIIDRLYHAGAYDGLL